MDGPLLGFPFESVEDAGKKFAQNVERSSRQKKIADTPVQAVFREMLADETVVGPGRRLIAGPIADFGSHLAISR